jgi:hypothetical protein
MDKCVDYGSDALNKVYGGMDCNYVTGNLPLTGLDIMLWLVVGGMLLLAGLVLRGKRI